jgi:hypothetical protein
MSNTLITPSIIAKEALMQLENNCVMGGLVHRDYEDEFVKVGSTISVRRPVQFTVTESATLNKQDVTEGKFSVAVDRQNHVAWGFSSADLTLTIDEYSERYIKPAVIQLANKIDATVCGLYKDVWNWTGTLGSVNEINSYADFAKGPERLDLGAVPTDNRSAVLSPSDHWALAGSQTALFFNSIGEKAYRRGTIGKIGNVDTYMSQNVATHLTGGRDDTTPLADAAAGDGVLTTTYALSKDSGEMILSTDGWDSTDLHQGDVFTINSVFAVNPVSKATLAHLQQFVVKADATVTSGDSEITVSPPAITSGAYQTVNEAPADADTILNMGTASTNYVQNMCFHKNAFALVMRPLVMPDGVAFKSKQQKNGYSIRVLKDYDIINDEEIIRLDVLYGVKTLDARLATRMSGNGT